MGQAAHFVFIHGSQDGLVEVCAHRVQRRGGGFDRFICLEGERPCPLCDADLQSLTMRLLLAWGADIRSWVVVVLDAEWKEALLDAVRWMEEVDGDPTKTLVTTLRYESWKLGCVQDPVNPKALPSREDIKTLGDPRTALREFIPLRTAREIIEVCPTVRATLFAKGLLENYVGA